MGAFFSAPSDWVGTAAEVAGSNVAVGAVGLPGLSGERHYSPKEIANLWGLSETKIRRLFEHEPGVIRIGEPSRRVGRKLKRSYYTMRISETAARTVYRRLTSVRSRT